MRAPIGAANSRRPQLVALLKACCLTADSFFLAAFLLIEFKLRDSQSPSESASAKANAIAASSGASRRMVAARTAPRNESLYAFLTYRGQTCIAFTIAP